MLQFFRQPIISGGMNTKSRMDAGLIQAIDAAGGIIKLAHQLGLTHQAVYQWRSVPTHQIMAIEELTGVPREVLRPDLYRAIRSSRAS